MPGFAAKTVKAYLLFQERGRTQNHQGSKEPTGVGQHVVFHYIVIEPIK